MSLSNLNIASISSMKTLSYASSAYQNVMKRLSTGLRINSASDDSAGLYMSKKLDNQSSGTEMATQNVQSASAKINTFGGYLQGITENLQKIRQLAVQAANGVYGSSERQMINNEVKQVQGGIGSASAQANAEITGTQTELLKPVAKIAEADAIAQGYVTIKTAAEFKALLSANPLGVAGKFMLQGDIDMSSLGTVDKAVITNTFRGTLDGNGYSINNLTINATGNNSGLFGYVDNAKIKNLALYNTKITSTANVSGIGALAGAVNWGNIDNCSVVNTQINAINSSAVGGLVGSHWYGTITACSAQGNIIGKNTVGGLLGLSRGNNVSSSSSSCDVTATGDQAGGLAGAASVNANISSSYATGRVSGVNEVGGFVGNVTEATVNNCFASGDATANNNSVGGFAGFMYGYDGDARISNSYSLGYAKGNTGVGGFVGDVTDAYSYIDHCYSRGNADGVTNVGGFAGSTSTSDGGVTTSWSDGEAKGTTNVGGFLGTYIDGINSGNSWNKDKSGNSTSAGSGATGYTNATMPTLSTIFSTWNTSLWDLTGERPELKSFVPSDFSVQSGATVSNRYTIKNFGINYTGSSSLDVSTVDNARRTIQNADDMLAYFASLNAKTGAAITALGSQVNSNMSRNEGFLAGNSAIKDADIAKETAKLAKYQMAQNFASTVLQQAGKLNGDFMLGMYRNM